MADYISPLAAEPAPLGTFARAIIVETSGHPVRRTLDCTISLAIHIAIIGVLSALPLFFLQVLHPRAFTRTVFLSAIPPPEAQPNSRSNVLHSAPESGFEVTKLPGPLVRTRSALTALMDSAPPEPITSTVNGGINVLPDGILTGQTSVSPVPPPGGQLIFAGGRISGSRLIYGLSLAYPDVAKMAHIFGRVIIDAVIDETGSVRKIRAVSGPELLADAALKAVSREKFEPMLLDGKPTSRDLTVVVNFRLF